MQTFNVYFGGPFLFGSVYTSLKKSHVFVNMCTYIVLVYEADSISNFNFQLSPLNAFQTDEVFFNLF
jgi:hypothetical protein